MANVLDMFKLDGKVALVTGGAGNRGFRGSYGCQITLALLQAGADVWVASRTLKTNEEFAEMLRKEGYDKKEAIVEAGMTILRPILMTALTTILAMSTMAFSSASGAEMMQPMAIVTIGGLIYGTLLTLVVVPCIYDLFNRNKSMVEEEL